jgi:hypothetical protein
VADEVRPLDPEVAHERAAVGGLIGDADRPGRAAAARVADAVVAEQAVAFGQGRFLHQALEPVRAHAGVDQHHRLPHSPDLVVQLDAVEGGPFQASLPHDPPPAG